MNLIKANILYDGVNERKGVFIGIENDTIQYVDYDKLKEEAKVFILDKDIVVTHALIDSQSHIGLQKSAEYSGHYGENEQATPVSPITNALHRIYMDDPAFKESVEHGILYSVALTGSGNVIGGKVVLTRNYALDIEEAFIGDVGIKAALGFHPRSMAHWQGK